jgi:hypothetical protein
VLRDETATVLSFRDAALRRPIDIVAWKTARAPIGSDADDAPDNVIPLSRFARAARRGRCGAGFAGPPEGEAA